MFAVAAAAKLLQSCPTLCDPRDGSPPGSAVPGIPQARTLEWVAFPSPMHESEKWKWSCSVVSDSSRPHGLHPTRLLHPWDFPGKTTGVGCHLKGVKTAQTCEWGPELGGWLQPWKKSRKNYKEVLEFGPSTILQMFFWAWLGWCSVLWVEFVPV